MMQSRILIPLEIAHCLILYEIIGNHTYCIPNSILLLPVSYDVEVINSKQKVHLVSLSRDSAAIHYGVLME
jgi:hypothetical protein